MWKNLDEDAWNIKWLSPIEILGLLGPKIHCELMFPFPINFKIQILRPVIQIPPTIWDSQDAWNWRPSVLSIMLT